jgi:aerobic-type carbon monoxide dehydrogenase small subunit (CoxS/CutS family)
VARARRRRENGVVPALRTLALEVNGDQTLVAAPDHWTLLEVLRYRLGLTGSKQGCDKGDCGACTVLVDGRPVLACITLAAAAVGHRVTTIEGLMPAHLAAGGQGADPVQDAFDRCGALQCGFCQPGMMLSARALLNEKARPTRAEINAALAGNLCRCTGYTQIVQAVELAIAEACGAAPADPSWKRPDAPAYAGSGREHWQRKAAGPDAADERAKRAGGSGR